MSCEFNEGREAALQIGIAAAWGTKVPATVRLPFLTEGLKYTPNYKEAENLSGGVLIKKMDIMSEHVEGDIEAYCTPDEIGYLLYLNLGVEYKVIGGPVASTYKHYFVPVKSGLGMCLPFFSAEVDRVKEVMTYDSLKMNGLTISAEKDGYVMFNFGTVGRDETDDGALTAGLTLSQKNFFKFRRAAVYGSILDSDYTVSATGTGVAAETCTVVPVTLTGASGLEIYVPVVDKNGVRSVYEFVGTPITRAATTLTFADSPEGATDDEINSVTLPSGLIDTANWNLATEEYGDVYSFEHAWDNNLPTDRQSTESSGKSTEMNPQSRSSTLSLGMYLNDTVNYMRKERFKKGRTMTIQLEFEVLDIITGATVYEFALLMDRVYTTEVPYFIDTADEITVDLSCVVADPAPADLVATAGGLAADTIVSDSGFTLHNGDYVRALDEDGAQRIYKYLGTDVTAASTLLTFIDDSAAANQVDSIWLAGQLFNDAYWQMAESVVAYAIDGLNEEWGYDRT